ncbi:hypothetical protein E4U55_007036 [Claviceps digitariae]|nr:hypothetical protein E4U55_007036 [Claviceps digitariae]
MSGGFYKYRCKYFYTHNCQNWVWVHNAPCATCLVSRAKLILIGFGEQAEGRDDEKTPSPHSMMSCDISMPCVQNGILQYTLMEFVGPTEPGYCWTLIDKAARPTAALPATSAMPVPYGLVSVGYGPQQSDSDFQILPYGQNMTSYLHAGTHI